MKSQKRGLLALEQLIQILIAILGIILVIIIFTKVASCGNTKELQAKGTLDKITQIIASLKENEPQHMDLMVPASWYIISFDDSHNENGGFKKPSKLFSKNALCICKDKDCSFCSQIILPLKENSQLVKLAIKPGNLTFIKQQDQINITFVVPKETK